ncbi:ATP11 protein-domain-containing protein [Crucibulum laeve]|uniref:ATP11 protein-domain-containing protein n=1 Tax=Crucibulum laeve TaxID=68775 RepID=A0A5C3LSD7_9AGAR|nr:ATP11 protein-domain-containing protein [Crucibulum laeve]
MHRRVLSRVCCPSRNSLFLSSSFSHSYIWRRTITNAPRTVDYESRYAEKLKQRAKERGLSVEELKAKAREQEEEAKKTLREAREKDRENKAAAAASAQGNARVSTAESTSPAPEIAKERKDSSPIKPLSSILNIPKILSTPHTPEQISALWNAYHLSRSGGTGRGFICASIPLPLYERMSSIGGKYPAFVVPLPRPKTTEELKEQEGKEKVEGESDVAYEFYFLQWDFHEAPAIPRAVEDPFLPPKRTTEDGKMNPHVSTVLFTPLQEYKLRNSFATPYMVLTHYTDLTASHGVVLLRGEITAGGGEHFLLSQADAQLLAMSIQKFYLWAEGKEGGNEREGERLLSLFHEKPEEFKWEELLKFASWTL